MESHIANQLNIPVTYSLITRNRKRVMNGSWLQDPVIARKVEQTNNMNMKSK